MTPPETLPPGDTVDHRHTLRLVAEVLASLEAGVVDIPLVRRVLELVGGKYEYWHEDSGKVRGENRELRQIVKDRKEDVNMGDEPEIQTEIPKYSVSMKQTAPKKDGGQDWYVSEGGIKVRGDDMDEVLAGVDRLKRGVESVLAGTYKAPMVYDDRGMPKDAADDFHDDPAFDEVDADICGRCEKPIHDGCVCPGHNATRANDEGGT